MLSAMISKRAAACPPVLCAPVLRGRRNLAISRFPVPSMGDSITEGTLLELHKRVGEYVAMEELVATVETDKVTVEVRSPAAGTITEILAGAEDNITVGEDLLEIDVGVGTPGASSSAAPAETAGPVGGPPAPASSAASTPAAAQARRTHPTGRPSLIHFRSQVSALSAAPEAAPAPAAPAGIPSKPAPQPTAKGPVLSPDELPARYRRLPMTEEEMEVVEMGGAGYVCN